MKYSRQADWPEVPHGETLAEMTGVSIGRDGHIYTLDRGGRAWKDRNAQTALNSLVIKRWSAAGEQLGAFGSGLFVIHMGFASIRTEPFGWLMWDAIKS